MSAPILPRFNQHMIQDDDHRYVTQIITESNAPDQQAPSSKTITRTDHTDTRRLRGIPVAGGACGTSPGTDPLTELLRKERAA